MGRGINMRYGNIQQGNRKDAQHLRRIENRKKSMEMTNKKVHKTKVCKCCSGEHRVQPGTKRVGLK